MFRSIKEFFNPRIKCERIGHDESVIEIKIRKEGGSYRSVVTDYKAKIKRCRRCFSYLSGPYDLKECASFTGCTMPSSMWDEIREKGYLIKD